MKGYSSVHGIMFYSYLKSSNLQLKFRENINQVLVPPSAQETASSGLNFSRGRGTNEILPPNNKGNNVSDINYLSFRFLELILK